MTKVTDLDEFLSRNRISEGDWKSANIEWSLLREIADDHTSMLDKLNESASMSARLIQRFDKVHSVRWRIKDSEHLLEKIVRKRADQVEKYLAITPSNYFEIVTDLVGIRALHLYKEDCFHIHQSISDLLKIIDTPVAYVRDGDPEAVQVKFQERGFKVEKHPAGYRSVHYIAESYPVSRRLLTEVQVRTIFEEGWSEIDHDIRYPNLSNNSQVEYFLTIFNRLAGSADEMGSFVVGLRGTLQQLEANLADANEEKQRSLLQMEKALSQLANATEKDEASNESIKKLAAEVAKLRADVSFGGLLSTTSEKSSGVGNLGFGLGSNFNDAVGQHVRRGIINGALTSREALGLLVSPAAAENLAMQGGRGSVSDAVKKLSSLGSISLTERDAVDRVLGKIKPSDPNSVSEAVRLSSLGSISPAERDAVDRGLGEVRPSDPKLVEQFASLKGIIKKND